MKFSLGKFLLVTAVVFGILIFAMSMTAFAESYGIGSVAVDTEANTITVPVTGAGTNQITIVVRTDNVDWLTDPNANVIYIDQVTGAGDTTNITFGYDEKWEVQATYKIFVGGSGMEVASADLVLSGGGEPEDEFIVSKVYTGNLGIAGKSLVEGTIDEGNGTKKVIVGGVELKFSTQRNLYIGLVDAAEVVDGQLPNAAITEVAPTTFVYGDTNGNGAFNVADVALARNYSSGNTTTIANIVAADANLSGTFNVADVALLRNVSSGNASFSFVN